MLDIFGREVKRGDIIALCTQSSAKGGNYQTYTRAKLGVVANILPKRQYKKGSWQYKRVFDRHQKLTYPSYSNTTFGSAIGAISTGNNGNGPMQLSKLKSLSVGALNTTSSGPDYYEVMEKITYIPFEVSGSNPANSKITKNGTPILRPHSSNYFLLVDKDSLSQEWKDAYDRVKQVYKI